MTADLAKFEQELLRRNAALEERAAASIARAKAVVEGQSHAHPPDAARATKTLAATHSPSRARRSAEAFLREAAAYYDEEEENTPPTPDQASFADDDEHESVEDDLDATRGPAFEPRGTLGGSPPAPHPRASPATFPPLPALLSRRPRRLRARARPRGGQLRPLRRASARSRMSSPRRLANSATSTPA